MPREGLGRKCSGSRSPADVLVLEGLHPSTPEPAGWPHCAAAMLPVLGLEVLEPLAIAGGGPGAQRPAPEGCDRHAFRIFILNLPSFHCQEPGKPWLCRLWGWGWARSNRQGL